MKPFDGAAFGSEVVSQVRKFVNDSTAPLIKEIQTLRSELDAIKSVDHGPAIARVVGDILVLRLNDTATEVETRVRATLPDVGALVSEAVAALPAAPSLDEVKSAAITELKPVLAQMTVEAVSTIPVPQDGKDGVDGKDAAPVDLALISEQIKQATTEAVSALPVPVDGRGIDDVRLGDDGVLRVILTDETTINVGVVVGPAGKDADTEALFQLIDDTFKAIPAPKDGVDGKDGKDADLAPAMQMLSETLAAIPKPKDGKDGVSVKEIQLSPEGHLEVYLTDGTFQSVGPVIGPAGVAGKDAEIDTDWVDGLVADKVIAAVKELPAPKDGKDGRGIKNLSIDDLGQITAAFTDDIEVVVGQIVGAPGADGKDADITPHLHEMAKTFAELSAKTDAAIASIQPGVGIKTLNVTDNVLVIELSDGETVVKHELPSIEAIVQKAVEQIPVPKDGAPGADGKDGVGLAGAIIDRDGELTVTNTLGMPFKLGPVVGKDVDMGAVAQMIEALPKPKDGLDAVGFENMDISFNEDTKELTVWGAVGDTEKTWKLFLPVLLDRGVFDEKHGEYQKGDGTTYGGSFWIAQKATSARPGSDDSWRLSVKKGKDGKDGKIPEPPKPVILDGRA